MKLTDREITALEIIRDSEHPLGAWNLEEILSRKGIQIGSSTVGRMLNRLEKQGYLTKKHFNQGRTITSEGRALLSRNQQEQLLKPLSERLGDMLNTRVLEKYLLVLEARKVLERAIVRLAAEQITDEKLKRLEQIVEQREERHRQSKSRADLDIAFHMAIAKACSNEVLSLLYQTVATLGQQSQLFELLRQRVGAPYLTSHREILEALISRDSDRAEECIVQHIDMLIGDVKKYWDTYFT
jgi:GntR family transcriptional repressor for pyruvate dehydrogenase complex